MARVKLIEAVQIDTLGEGQPARTFFEYRYAGGVLHMDVLHGDGQMMIGHQYAVDRLPHTLRSLGYTEFDSVVVTGV